MNILLLEDEMLIALDLEMTLRELGATDVRLCTSVDQALTVLASLPVDCAFVDYNLGIETAEPLLHALERRGMPFIVMSGYPDSRSLGDGTRNWPLISKPVSMEALRSALEAMRPKD